MTFRTVTTPLRRDLDLPTPREGGFPPELFEACLTTEFTPAGIERLRDPDVVVVTTGQQPALFTGPLYGIHKALSAAVLAEHLERRWQRPVVPMFWVAGDDHDFAEANHAAWHAADGTLTTWALPARDDDAALTPMYREGLGASILEGLDLLESTLPDSEFRNATLEWVRRHYTPERTVAQAYAGAMAELLAPWGIVCFDSTHPAVKRRAAPFLMKAVGLAQDLDRDLARRDDDLKAADADPKVHVGDGATLVMLEADQGRDRLTVDGSHLITRRSGETFTLESLNALAASDPERFSPNVLLRPVMESALLPTVAYVAGPGELRYLPLTDPVYRRLRVPQQMPVPRWSGLVVERRVDRVLEKFDADLEELAAPDQALERRVVLSHMPPEVTDAVTRVTENINRAYDVLAAAGTNIDPTMAKPVEGSRRQALGAVEHIEKRLRGHLKQRETTELRQIAHARDAVFPAGAPQERVLCAPSFLARYGEDFLTALRATIHDWYGAALEGEPVRS